MLLAPEAPYEDDDVEHLQDPFEAVAREYLDPETARRWLALGRPTVELVGGEGPVVARLGGVPHLPAGTPWPHWEGHGPLAFVGEVDLAALAAAGLRTGIELPTTGRLLAFHWDGEVDDFETLVGCWDPATAAGAVLLHVAAGRDTCPPTQVPEPLESWTEVELTGRQAMSYPASDHPAVSLEFGMGPVDDHPVTNEDFEDEVMTLQIAQASHRLGGYTLPDQGPTEFEVMAFKGLSAEGEDGDREAVRWYNLLQVGSDDATGMCWGDEGKLYWMTRPDAEEPVADAGFTWQCA